MPELLIKELCTQYTKFSFNNIVPLTKKNIYTFYHNFSNKIFFLQLFCFVFLTYRFYGQFSFVFLNCWTWFTWDKIVLLKKVHFSCNIEFKKKIPPHLKKRWSPGLWQPFPGLIARLFITPSRPRRNERSLVRTRGLTNSLNQSFRIWPKYPWERIHTP